nr:hypothetical protein [Tanacetum cinerariifolium]
MAFVSSTSNNSNNSTGVNTTQGVNTANRVNTASSHVNAASALNIDNLSDAVICAFLASKPNSTHLVSKDLEQIHPDDLKEMDLKWQMAMLTIPKSVERVSVLHQPDGVGSKRHHIIPIGDLNGVLVALDRYGYCKYHKKMAKNEN